MMNVTYDLSEGIERVVSSPVWNTGFSVCDSQIAFIIIDIDTGLAADS